MLGTVYRRAPRLAAPLNFVGIEDWAFRRGQRYGTLVCDLERRRVSPLLPDRKAATRASLKTIRIADRRHLIENASAAFLDAVRESTAAICIVVGAAMIDLDRLICAERLQYEGYHRRAATVEANMTLPQKGI